MDYRILGSLEVWRDDQEVPLGGAKQRALLAILLIHANQVVSVDRLIEDLWGEEAPASAPNVIQTYVSRLRKALEQPGVPAVLESRKPGYVIHVRPEELDVSRHERLLERARDAMDKEDPASASSMYSEALNLWRGEPLSDFTYEAFAQREIERLRDLRVAAMEGRIEAELAIGGGAELVGELHSLAHEYPLRERLRGQLMLALYRSGRQAEALQAYQDARRALADELGIDPGPDLQGLERAILNQDPSLGVRAAASEAATVAAPRDGPSELPKTDRSILIAPQVPARLEGILALVEPLARMNPAHELVLARLLGGWEVDSPPDGPTVAQAVADLGRSRAEIVGRGLPCRVVAFTSQDPGEDLARLARDHPLELAIVDGTPDAFEPEGGPLLSILERMECDVAILITQGPPPAPPGTDAPVMVPFGGTEHDWSAVELAAALARAHHAPLQLLGTSGDPESGQRDASRLLASASMVVQGTTGQVAEPVLVPAGAAVAEAVRKAGLVVMGLSERWRTEGLGRVRTAIVKGGEVPALILRRGARDGAAEPREDTRYTWSTTGAASGRRSESTQS